jgi:hypothetical protein
MGKRYSRTEKLRIVEVAVLAVVIVLSMAGITKPIKVRGEPTNKFTDPDYEVSFEYPQDFTVRSQETGGQKYLQVFPQYLENEADPNIVDIVYEEDTAPEQGVEKSIYVSFPESTRNSLRKINIGGITGYQIQETNSGETSIYSYIKHNGLVYLFKFNQSYFENNAPAPLSNKNFLGAYYQILNSVNFTVSTGRTQF